MSSIEVKVPDIGDFTDVPVIEVLVKAGDTVKLDDSLVTLESDKATMDVPAPAAGTIKSVAVKVGDKVSEGALVLVIEAAGAASSPQPSTAGGNASTAPTADRRPPASATAQAAASSSKAPSQPTAPSASPASTRGVAVKVPDIGDFTDIPVIEVFVKAGDTVKVDDALVTLESDKATMDVPAPVAGVVKSVAVKVGDKVSQGALVGVIEAAGAAPSPQPAPAGAKGSTAPAASPPTADHRPSPSAPAPDSTAPNLAAEPAAEPVDNQAFRIAHASPSVRLIARELGVDLARVTGTGPKTRILIEDVRAFVKHAMSGAAAAPGSGASASGGGLHLIPWPKVDFAKFGPIESKPLSRIKKLSGANLARNWVMIPHVTQFD
ncbi:MAG: biotin/lipoyl-containing protein, partial [Betaproteobacteria bacterium]